MNTISLAVELDVHFKINKKIKKQMTKAQLTLALQVGITAAIDTYINGSTEEVDTLNYESGLPKDFNLREWLIETLGTEDLLSVGSSAIAFTANQITTHYKG